jgi:hypothetical protein
MNRIRRLLLVLAGIMCCSGTVFAMSTTDLKMYGSCTIDWNAGAEYLGAVGSYGTGSITHDGQSAYLNYNRYGGSAEIADSTGSASLTEWASGMDTENISNGTISSSAASGISDTTWEIAGPGWVNFIYTYLIEYTLSNTMQGETASVLGSITVGNRTIDFSDTLTNIGTYTMSRTATFSELLNVTTGEWVHAYVEYEGNASACSPIPEPSTAALLAMGLGSISLFLIRRRRV